jgi:hypothetical protein
MLAISLQYRMAIAKNPSRKTKMTNKQAKKFIIAASAHQTEGDGRFIQTQSDFHRAFWLGLTEPRRKED